MRLIAVLLSLLVSLAAAAEPRRFAVLSLIGDELSVAAPAQTIGSRIERSPRTLVRFDDPTLDHAALLAADDALRQHDPGAKPILLAARNPAHLALQAKALDDQAAFKPMIDAIRASLGEVTATHLVLISKYRYEASIKLDEGHVGTGMLQGLGFYIDPRMQVTNIATGENAVGFIAPFAYFRATLVDLATGRIVRDEPVIASYVRTTARSDDPDPWKAMSAEEKVRILRDLVRKETLRVTPLLLR